MYKYNIDLTINETVKIEMALNSDLKRKEKSLKIIGKDKYITNFLREDIKEIKALLKRLKDL